MPYWALSFQSNILSLNQKELSFRSFRCETRADRECFLQSFGFNAERSSPSKRFPGELLIDAHVTVVIDDQKLVGYMHLPYVEAFEGQRETARFGGLG